MPYSSITLIILSCTPITFNLFSIYSLIISIASLVIFSPAQTKGIPGGYGIIDSLAIFPKALFISKLVLFKLKPHKALIL